MQWYEDRVVGLEHDLAVYRQRAADLEDALRWRGCSVRDDEYAHPWCFRGGRACPAWSVPLARCTAFDEESEP